MLYRKIESFLVKWFKEEHNKILIIDGARQIGKSFIIRKVGQELFENYIELNFVLDKENKKLFEKVTSVEDFYFTLSTLYGEKMKEKNNTLIFLDEIQEYPNLITLLKFLNQDNKYTFIASGSLLGLSLADTSSIPIGSIKIKKMYQLDFEEFLIASGTSFEAISILRKHFEAKESLNESMHNMFLDLFKKYLIVGGLPDCVNEYLLSRNVVKIRTIQDDIIRFYKDDASKYDSERKLKIKRIYDMIPSVMQNIKKRIVFKEIEEKSGKRFSNYADEFDYLISSGIVHEVKAISNPSFPLCQSENKNLIKLYINDVGLLSNVLYKNNIRAILDNEASVNLGSLYETAIASILKSQDFDLYYYDNRKNGEVDFLLNDYDNLSVLPIVVKSGRNYLIHSALNKLLSNNGYNIKEGIVLSNDREIRTVNNITYYPIYFAIFLRKNNFDDIKP